MCENCRNNCDCHKQHIVVDSVTGKTFVFKNIEDSREFFKSWDKLVIDVLDREDEF